jgi:hypothetical protein
LRVPARRTTQYKTGGIKKAGGSLLPILSGKKRGKKGQSGGATLPTPVKNFGYTPDYRMLLSPFSFRQITVRRAVITS